MKYISLFSFFCLFLNPICSWGQCEMEISTTEGCIPLPVSFKAVNNSGKTIQSYSWDFGDSKNSTETEPVHVYRARGTFSPVLNLTFSDGSNCQVQGDEITVYGNPSVTIDLNKSYKLCWDERFLRLDLSYSESPDKAPSKRFVWDFDDGDTSEQKNPRHYFQQNGKYNIRLEATDTNGCKDTAEKTVDIRVFERIFPRFSKFGRDSCPSTSVRFNNQTDSNGWYVNELIWKFGDGKSRVSKKSDADWSNYWKGVNHTYTTTGIFLPKLVVKNAYGCADSAQFFKIENVFFKFDVSVSPDSACFGTEKDRPIIQFSQPPIDGAESWLWTFGEPTSQSNTAQSRWEPIHQYALPGKYSVNLKVKVKGCVRDTTYCDIVKIYGPLARINRENRRYFDRRDGYPFGPEEFPLNFDSCSTDSVVYYTLDTVEKTQLKFTYCNADTTGFSPWMQAANCKGEFTRYNYELRPTGSYPVKVKEVNRTQYIWRPGMPLPNAPVYKGYRGMYVAGNVHDTDYFDPDCTPPHTVSFPNNTIKYRMYEAPDNFPPGLMDSCINPSYPYATDSLEYFWSFSEGEDDTSTAANPNEFARYSTERLPTHTFLDSGCHKVTLIAYDPETGCSSYDTLFIAVQHPNADFDRIGFDTVKRMDYRTQRQLDGAPFLKGMQLDGLECTGYKQVLNLEETLPSCQKQQFWVVWDSLEDVNVDNCHGDTIITYNWVASPKLPRERLFTVYDEQGWIDLGLVIQSGEKYDTVWYHNYKYIFEGNAFFGSNGRHFCEGDTLINQFIDSTQQGVRYAWFMYTYQENRDDDPQILAYDTLDYLEITGRGNVIRHITSTMDNTEVGIVDDTIYNNLLQKSKIKLGKPGIYTVHANILQRMGCERYEFSEIAVGHKASFGVDKPIICLGDSVRFLDSVYYYKAFNQSPFGDGIDTIPYWRNPIGGRGGVVPRNPEKIKWDFNNDGVIDDSSATPYFVYDTPGVYTVVMYTLDSLRCGWVETVMEDIVQVVGIEADFAVEDDDTLRFCAPQFFVFEDKTKILDGGRSGATAIDYWLWEWGDGKNTIKSSLNNGTTGRIYSRNGIYEVTMKVYLDLYQVYRHPGCYDSVQHTIYIEGPKPQFALVGDTVGCAPFYTEVQDFSRDVSVWEWSLGDGRTKSTKGESLVGLSYPNPGTYCIQLEGGDSIVDFFGDTLYCTERFPEDSCQFKVRVLDRTPLQFTGDTLLCPYQEGFFELGDTAEYQRFYVDYGDGLSDSADLQFSHSYTDTGNYQFRYTGIGPLCPDTQLQNIRVITVLSKLAVDSNQVDTPQFVFINNSDGGVRYEWIHEGYLEARNNKEPFSYRFESTGIKKVCLVAFNANDCPDTACLEVNVFSSIQIPNVFSPNEDGFNDRFQIPIDGDLFYRLKIFNRWGEVVFTSDDNRYQWNGNVRNGSNPCPQGTYFYLFEYELIGEERRTVHGTITLLRK